MGKDSSYGPVYNVYAGYVSRADGHIVAFVVACGIQPRQVVWVVTEVGVHFKNIIIVVLKRPLEPCYISCAQPELASSLNNKKAVGKLVVNKAVYDFLCAVGRTVVNNKYMESLV